jgi:subtilisin-like proprotein convertase family protein
MGLYRSISVLVTVAVAACATGRGEAPAVPLFGPGAGVGARSAGLVINQDAVSQLRSGAPSVTLGAVPLITGDSASFELTPMPVIGPNAQIQVVRAGGTTESLSAPDIRTWYGTDAEHPDRAMFISARPDGQVQAMITGDAQTSVTVISRDTAAAPDQYQIERAVLPPKNFCTVEDIKAAPGELTASAMDPRAVPSNVVYQADMMIDVGYHLFTTGLDSDTALTLDYLTNLFGAVNVIYHRDLKLHLNLAHVIIWADQDPFSPPDTEVDTFVQIRNYQSFVAANRFHVDMDLAHLIDSYPVGGRAYLAALQSYRREIRCGVSNVDAIGSFPTDGSYYWDTMVVAHEIGHNVGSPHTQCYSPPMDCCAIDPGCTDCTFEKPALGTIMSYCHLQFGNGGGIDMRFHERCISMMRHLIESSLLLSPYTPKPDIEIRGSEGSLIPLNSLVAKRSTLLRSPAIGTPVTQEYVIHNSGGEPVVLTGNPRVELLDLELKPLAAGSAFTVQSQPAVAELAAGASTKFTLQYQPKNETDQWVVVQVRSTDPDEGVYRFLVKGRLLKPSDPAVGTNVGDVVIPEQGGAWTQVPVVIEDVPGDITNVQVRFNGTDCSVDALTGIEHPYIGDLIILLESPSGTTMTLVQNAGATTDTEPGAAGRNFCHTLLTSEPGAPSIQDVTADEAPYSETYLAKDDLSIFVGEQPNGTWKFWFYDRAKPDQGIVHSISVLVRGDTAAAMETGPPIVTRAGNWSLFE